MREEAVGCYKQTTKMKRKRFKEEQIITILKEAEAGLKVADLVRGMSHRSLKLGGDQQGEFVLLGG